MRSRRNALAFGFAFALASCGSDVELAGVDGGGTSDAVSCVTSYLTYQNVGEPFMANWCRGCHSANLPPDMRQMAPADINFDTLDDVHSWSDMVVAKATESPTTMPPEGGPSDTDRALIAAWIQCGAPP